MLKNITLPQPQPTRVLAFGAFLKNGAGLLDGARFLASPNHGDLGTPEACAALDASITALIAAASGPIDAIAHDLHPDFYSTQAAHVWSEHLGVPAYAVQHHHAHIAVVQAEQGLSEPVLGLALDGVGLGTDGTAWGGEVLISNGRGFERIDHLPPLFLPGGDVAAREPWRMAAAVMTVLGQRDQIEPRFTPVVGAEAARIVATLLGRGLNCPVTTGAGRWFDAAAGVLGLSVRQAEEAEAAIALERAATAWLAEHPGADWPQDNLNLLPLFAALLGLDATQQGQGAAHFHLALVNGLAAVARHTAEARGLSTVVLGGGCFFNRLLSERLARALHASGLTVLRPQALSCGDAGLALGQAWVAAHRYQAGIRPYTGEDDDDPDDDASPFRRTPSCA